MVSIKTTSSLIKVFPFDRFEDDEVRKITRFSNEPVAFQVVVCDDESRKRKICLSLEFSGDATVREVGLVPSFMGQNFENECDDYYIIKDRPSTYYPDVLLDAGKYSILTVKQQKSFWVSVFSAPAGTSELKVFVKDYVENTLLGEVAVEIETLKTPLPELSIPNINWIYYDSLSDYYKVDLSGDEFREILGNYLDNALAHGINAVFVPVHGIQVDDEETSCRKSIQLVDIERKNGEYKFDFKRVFDFMDFVSSRGIKYFEIPHIASQWMVEKPVKFMAKTENGYEQIFGNDDSAFGEEFLGFLRAYLTDFTKLLDEKGYSGRVFFHIADEPILEAIDNYAAIRKVVKESVGNYPVMDALAAKEYAERNLMDIYVPSTDVATNFLGKVDHCWTYYCFCQCDKYLSNRTFNMPSLRNRIIGFQLYLNDIEGFLHWGYNYWFDGVTGARLNPYLETDAGNNFSGGDSYLVYPGTDGKPVDSIRNEVFYEGINDYRAMTLLEKYYGKQFCLGLLKEWGMDGLSVYPHSESWHHALKNKIIQLIKAATQE